MPILTLFDEYRAAGWQVCDIPPGTKGPTSVGWNLRGAQAHGQQGLGLCHAYSGTCAVDVDDYLVAIDWLHKQGIDLDALLEDPRSVQIVSGKVNRAKLLYKLATPLPSLSLAPYERLSAKTGKMQTFHALELRCAARNGTTVQDVLPPTIHPETLKPYTWAYGDDTFGHWSNLPELPSAILALWTAQVSLSPPETQAPQAPKGASLAEVVKLVATQDPNGKGYDEWLKMGARIHHETGGSAAGYEIWCEWSARCDKHNTEHMPTKWRSFHADAKNPVTLGGLRREEVAAPTDFEALAAPDVGVDTRYSAVAAKTLSSLVWIGRRSAVYDSDRGYGLDAAGVSVCYTHAMPVTEEGKQVDAWAFIRRNGDLIAQVDDLGLHPGAGKFYEDDGARFANVYVPEVVEPLAPTIEEKEILEFLWGRILEPHMAVWLKRFYAFAVQHPGVKISSAPLLFGKAQGTGKSTLAKRIPELLFGRRWVRVVTGDVLGGTFSDVLGETWWLHLEELRSTKQKMDRMALTNKVKPWITEPTVEVHPKGFKAYQMRNRLQLTATSNHDDAIHIEDGENERRWAVIAMRTDDSAGKLRARQWWTARQFLDGPRSRGVLRHVLSAIDVSDFNPNAWAPQSDAKQAMARIGVGLWESRIVERMVHLEPPFDRDVFRLKDVQEYTAGLNAMSAQALGSMMRAAPFNCETLKGAQGVLWCWRNTAFWRGKTETARLRHMETGEVSAGGYRSLSIPATIVAMSADGGVDSPNADLLG